MTRTRSDAHPGKKIELRIVLDATDYADICSLAKISGLAASQYSRQVLKRHLARIYGASETKETNL